MTIMLDGSTPKIDEPRAIEPKPTFFTPALLMVLAAGTLTFLNLAAAVYTFRSTSSLIDIEERLSDLKTFEDRVAGRLDMMNNGIQARLDMLQSDVRGQVAAASRNETVSSLSPPSVDELPDDLSTDGLDMAAEAAPTMSIDVQEEIHAEAPPPKRSSKPMGKAATYERIQSPDGKVYYRKTQ